ncbi:hypothetical protein BDV09DRAFT_203309 [Aspergillus tetrazonus]
MRNINLDQSLLENLAGKTAILTGAAGGIGTAIATLLLNKGANVVLADLAHTRQTIESMISALPEVQRSRALFIPTNIVSWSETSALFRSARNHFGRVDIVVANAGIMETTSVLDDLDTVDEEGNLVEHAGFSTVIDVNVKGTMNCLRQALFHMKQNKLLPSPGSSSCASRGAVVLVSSVSGYFGGTGVAGYVTSKHAVTGMLRASQLAAVRYGIRVNAVAPFVTPTAMSGGFSQAWCERGLPTNTTSGVAEAVLVIAVDPTVSGGCYMVVGRILREVEHAQKDVLAEWLGEDLAGVFREAAAFFESQGGYQLPKARGTA